MPTGIVSAANGFARGIWSQLTPSGNCVMSPLGLWAGLSMLAEGARGRTREQLVSALRLVTRDSNDAATTP